MLRSITLLAAIFFLASGLSASAASEKRVALIVGNSTYRAVGKLPNPISDARLVATALAAAHFATVETRTDLGIAEFRQALRRFQRDADGAEIALIYFAGHGIEAHGINWLIPIDAELREVRDLEYEAIKLDLALQALGGARMRVLVLDACRNNPFGRSWASPSREVERGLKRQEVDDVLVLFSAAPGQVALDGTGNNSPFAMALSKRLPEAGLAIQLIGGRVRDDVLLATGGAQRPYVSASITGEPFYLVPSPEVGPAPVVSSERPNTSEDAAHAWALVKESMDLAALQAFRRQFGVGNPFYDRLAEARIEEIQEAEAERQRQADKRKREAQAAAAAAAERQRQAAATEVSRRNSNEPSPQEIAAIVDVITDYWNRGILEPSLFAGRLEYYGKNVPREHAVAEDL